MPLNTYFGGIFLSQGGGEAKCPKIPPKYAYAAIDQSPMSSSVRKSRKRFIFIFNEKNHEIHRYLCASRPKYDTGYCEGLESYLLV